MDRRKKAGPILNSNALTGKYCFLQEHPTQVCGCPQPPLLAYSLKADSPHLMSVQGTQVDVWRLGQTIDRQVTPRLCSCNLSWQ